MAVRGIPLTVSAQEDVIVPVTGNPSFFVGIDFDAQEKTLFFSDTSVDMIYKQKIDGTGEKGLYNFLCVLLVLNNNANTYGLLSKTLYSILKRDALLNTFSSGKEIYCFSCELSFNEYFYFHNYK